jgi:hypothetical protein
MRLCFLRVAQGCGSVFLVVERLYLLSMRLGPNYAAIPGMVRGEQKVGVLSGSETILSATSASHVTDASKCNFNFNSRHKLYQPVIFGVYIRVSGNSTHARSLKSTPQRPNFLRDGY